MPAQVTIFGYGEHDPIDSHPISVSIPPGSTYMLTVFGNDFNPSSNYVTSSSPVRISVVSTDPCWLLSCSVKTTIAATTPTAFTVPPTQP
jgi:hypothetical protein